MTNQTQQKLIVKIIFGSHLYGTDTPESDKDYKGIFVPTTRDILLGNIPKSINTQTKKGDDKNTKDDIDTEIYSLHYFIKLACDGETAILDMLHAPDNMIIVKSEIWDEIIKNRSRFYTKNLKAFIGYARKQASKYGIKGSRLNDAKKVFGFLHDRIVDFKWASEEYGDKYPTLKEFWDELPEGEHIIKHEPDEKGIRLYEVCNRKIPDTARINYAYNIVHKFYKNYGERAIKAAYNEGIDWKAVSHAMRAAYQIKEILTDGTITFPLKEAEYLKQIKQGKLDFLSQVSPKLDDLMDEVEELSKKSNLPEKVNRKWWDDWLCSKLKDLIKEEFKCL